MARSINEKDHADRRNEILNETQRLVYTKGYQQMTIQDLLDGLQISKGAFYHYYDSKQSLLEALVARMIDEAEQLINPILLDPNLKALEKLRSYFDTGTRWKTDRKAFFLALLRTWYADDNTLIRQKVFSATLKHFGRLFTQVIRQGVDEGVFHTGYPEQVSEVVISIFQSQSDGITELLLSDRPPDEMRRVLLNMAGVLNESMERVLGAAPGSLRLVDSQVLLEWVPDK